MRSKTRKKSPTGPIPLCRIGERVFLSPLAVESELQQLVAAKATRQLDVKAGERTLLLHVMPADFQADAFDALPDLRFLMDHASLTTEERIDLLRSLYGFAARLLRLQSDPLLIALALSLANAPDLPKATIRLDLIEGYDTAIATIPVRARFRAGDVLISLSDDRMAIGQIERVHDFLAFENPRQRLAVLPFSGTPDDGEYLLIGAAGLMRVDVQIHRSETAEAFHAEHGRTGPDLTGLYAQSDEAAAIVLNRLARNSPPAPVVHEPLLGLQMVLDSALPLANGLFASGWFHDPDNLVTSVTAVDHSLENPEISAVWKVFDGRTDILGKILPVKCFVAFLPATRHGLPPAVIPVRVQLSNGESHLMIAEPSAQNLISQRERILGAIAGHAFTTDMLEDVFAPALAPIQQAISARQSVRQVKAFGQRSRRAVSLIVPIYKQTGFIRSQLMAFAVDPDIGKDCEIVYVLDDPMIAVEVAAILEGAAIAFHLDLKLVTLDRNGGYALANNMGVSQAEGDTLVLMNSDVIPDRPGWLRPALERLATLPPFSVIGPKLLYADDSLQHAGMYFYQLPTGYWQNFHFWKGYGRHFSAADVERTVPAVTGACMILRRADYMAVGGFTTDYIIGDYEDSDLCLKLRDRQGVALYMPSIELYHFERQSMSVENDDGDFGSTLYNRVLHTMKWGDRIPEANAAAMDAAHA